MQQSRLKMVRKWIFFKRRAFLWVQKNTERIRTTENLFIIGVSIIIGLLGGLGAVGFRWLISAVQSISHPDWGKSTEVVLQLPWYYKMVIPAIGGAIVGPLVYFFAREAKGHGVPEVMEAVALHSGRIRPRVVFIKAFASAINIGTGGSVGREGPIAQIGSAAGSTLGQIFKVNVRRLRTFVGCGAAAGIAATFNAPIAGVLFALEIILGDFAISRFSPIVISSVMATAISRHYLGDLPALIVPSYTLASPIELVFYGLLGIFAALVGVAFTRILYFSEDLYERVPIPEYTKPITGGFLIGTIGIFFPQIFGVGYETIDQALLGNLGWQLLILLLFAKILATSITLGSGGSGGIFAPSLFIGSMLGGFFGFIVHNFFPQISGSSGAYALVAMGAVVSATTHAPITSILIIFELTSDYKLILPLMITCILSTLLSTYLMNPSIYTLKLIRRGINIFKGREVNVLKSLKVGEVMSRTFETIPPNMKLSDIFARLSGSSHSVFFITESDNKMIGAVTFYDILNILSHRDTLEGIIIAHDIARFDLPILTTDDTLDLVMKLFSQNNVEEFPVVDSDDSNCLIGTIQREHVIDAYNREVAKLDLAGEFSSMVSTAGKRQVVELGENYSMVEIEAPRFFVGKTIRRLHIRARYGVQILLIKKPDPSKGMTHFVPHPDYVIQEEDILLLAGGNDNIRRVSNL